MEFEQKVLLSLLGVVLGFMLSQSINIVRYFRRPKFRLRNYDDGVLSCYTGDTPETPSEVEFGFYLENNGLNPAKNSRVFLSELRSAAAKENQLDDALLEFSELAKPIDLIPPGEAVKIVLGKLTSDKPYLVIGFEKENSDDLAESIEADTRWKKFFSAKFYVTCDNLDSFTIIEVDFRPESDGWAASILSDEFFEPDRSHPQWKNY